MAPMTELEKTERRIRQQASDPRRSAFATRAMNAILILLGETEPSELPEITAAPSDFDVLIRALHRIAETEAMKARAPLLAARLRGLKMREELLSAHGGPLAVSRVASLLRVSRQAVDKRRKSGRLLAVNIGRRGYLYPAWQFEEQGLLGVMPSILAKLRDHSAWSILRFFLNGNFRLGGHSPLAALRRGKIEKVLAAVAEFGKHGAA